MMGAPELLSRPWTVEGLAALWTVTAGGASLFDAAQAVGRTREECDRALWALVGRTPAQAIERLNRGDTAAAAASRRTMGRFVERLFGERAR